MTEPDLNRLAGALEDALPGLRPLRPLKVLGRGSRSLALETPGGVVVRVGLLAGVAADYERERRIGQFLAKRLRGLVPEARWHAPPSAALPHGAIAYRKLAGAPPAWGADPGPAFSGDLGAFMARLHTLPVTEAREAGVPKVDAYRRLLGGRDVVMPVLAARLRAAARRRVEAWWEAIASDGRMATARRTVCHHDLWHENLLRRESGGLAGVLDLAHVEIADPAQDFAAPRHFGEAFFERLVAAYVDAGGKFGEGEAHRAWRYWEAREFAGLAWAIENDEQGEVEEGVGKILAGPLFRR
jgi:aminoglycoside phosphotransferase (APT) family kinase protein